ncbi:MAG: alcohol dehydrogenase, partial [Candidatus Dadabacteria bacterium]
VLGYGPAMGDLPGVQAELGRIPFADVNLRKIPDGVDERRALFCGDNLTTVWGALKNVDFKPGESLAIVGCGPIGLQAILAAQVMQAGMIVAIDLLPQRLAQAEAFGATIIDGANEDVIKRARELTNKAGFDVILEAVGGPGPLETAFNLVGPGSRVTAVGVSNQPVFNYPLLKGLTWDITFRIGLANIHRDWDETLRLVERGVVEPERVVSNDMALDEAAEAYELFDRREATKILLHP